MQRVRLMALNLTRCPSLADKGVDMLVVELAACVYWDRVRDQPHECPVLRPQ